MKKTNLSIKLAGLLVFVALLAYLGVYVARALDDPYRTVTATTHTTRDSVRLTGLVAREEEVLQSVYSTVYIAAGEGKRVAAGEVVAEAFDSDDALRRAVRIGEVEAELERLQGLYSGAAVADVPQLDAQIETDIAALRTSVYRRSFDTVEALTRSLQTQIFAVSSDREALLARMDVCREELASLRERESARSAAILAPSSGVFSAVTDGWEELSPEALRRVTVSQLTGLLAEKRSVPAWNLGKLVYGTRWYYAALTDEASAARLYLGERRNLVFGRYYSRPLTMTVEFISSEEGGQRAVLFSCNTSLTDTLGMRRQDAELVFTEETGLRVPRKGLHVDEAGEVCVYTQTGLQAEKKPVRVMFDYGDYYVVESEALRAGDKIIVSAKNLYDGKVVG